ncbi:ATP-binding cassette domain-containing protein [Thermogemmatispora sp.]|uniref:ATP-binding cassette domain-containing protein n=1 Tax=Thermogemmatispora sp. TaxID=1968838 RepID=UPI00338F0539
MLRLLLGMLTPTSGRVELFGAPMTSATRRGEALRRVGALIEAPTFYPYLSGRDNLRVISLLTGLPEDHQTEQRISRLLERLALPAESSLPFKQYSLGMKQRLGIAAALLTELELLVLDEPTNGLDPIGLVHLRELLRSLAQRGTTILFSRHLLHEVQQLCTRVVLLKRGQIVAQGEVSQLLQTQGVIEIVYETPKALDAAEALLQRTAQEQPAWIRQVRRAGNAASVSSAEARVESPCVLQIQAPIASSTEICALLARHALYPAEIHRHSISLEQFFLDQASEPAPTLSQAQRAL